MYIFTLHMEGVMVSVGFTFNLQFTFGAPLSALHSIACVVSSIICALV